MKGKVFGGCVRRKEGLRANFMRNYTANLMTCQVTVLCGIGVETTEELGESPFYDQAGGEGAVAPVRF